MEFMSKFLLKFLWWCISHEPMIRNHSCLYPRHLCPRVYSFRFSVHMFVRLFVRYSGTFAEFMSKFLLKFLWSCISHESMIRNHSYFNRRYPIGFALFLHVGTMGPCPGVGLEVKI